MSKEFVKMLSLNHLTLQFIFYENIKQSDY